MSSPALVPALDVVRPYRVCRVHVLRTAQVTPRMRRITVGGPELATITSGGLDQRIKMLFPLPGQDEPVVPSGSAWYQAYQELPDEVRPPMRTYTVRGFRPSDGELDVDFVLHGDTGPASRWAGAARPGDRLAIVAPDRRHDPIVGYEYRPSPEHAWSLIAGDETALPAIGAIVESLAAGQRALVFAEVAEPSEIQVFATAADVRFTWACRAGAARPGSLLDAVREAEFPDGTPYAWIAGEAGGVRQLRRHLVTERSLDKESLYFSGYWKAGELSS
ncbi:siderophore-interacting protein [Amycolatopsis nigrescens]|uniref:siderophore-interacting protein n=1 Tax=Amycolatopsis nigrescens TaxID=381445 RepID=UPI0007C564B2|nr:siderophore-interacting protein [Amycolatopsis nigrescens]